MIVAADAERTMCTYLGAGAEIDPSDVDADRIGGAAVTYLEGYLWDEPAAKDAIRRAASLAQEADRRVAFTLSDPFCVERHRDEFRELVASSIDVLFANEDEITMLYEVDTFDDAARLRCPRAARSPPSRAAPQGSVVVNGRRASRDCGGTRSRSWSTRPGPATCTPPDSCSGSRTATTWRRAGASARSARRR